MTKILVLLSSYNGDRFIKEQIESVLSQKDVNVNLLIRDDGSTDDTLQILHSLQLKHNNIDVVNGQNVGCADSFRWLLNEAYIRRKEYDYFSFCDQDDFWLPEKLSIACKELDRMGNTKPCMYCSNLHVVDENLKGMGLKWNPDESFITKEQSLVCSMATGCTMVFNNPVLEVFYNFPPQQLRVHDLWVMHICMFLGYIYYDRNSYILYRQHGHNVIGAKTTLKSKMKSRWLSLKHLLSQNENRDESREILSSYGHLLSDEDRKKIETVANYKENWKNRLRFLFRIGTKTQGICRKKDNYILNIRVFLGVV